METKSHQERAYPGSISLPGAVWDRLREQARIEREPVSGIVKRAILKELAQPTKPVIREAA